MNDESQLDVQQDVTQAAEEPAHEPQAETPPWLEKTETPAPQKTDSQDPDEHLKKARGGFQRRIDELVREREYERSEKQKLLELFAKTQSAQQAPPTQVSPKADDGMPNLDNFDDYGKYLSAVARHEARQEHAALRKQEEETQAKTRHETVVADQHRRMVEKQTTLKTMTEAAEKKYPDFFDKVFNQSPDVMPITPIIGEAILESDIGQDVAYYLATHTSEAQRLAKLSPTAALREFGKIEASLITQQSSAPKPISPVGGKQVSSDAISDSDDMATYIAKRNKQLGRKR
jgi:hypothetical protein